MPRQPTIERLRAMRVIELAQRRNKRGAELLHVEGEIRRANREGDHDLARELSHYADELGHEIDQLEEAIRAEAPEHLR